MSHGGGIALTLPRDSRCHRGGLEVWRRAPWWAHRGLGGRVAALPRCESCESWSGFSERGRRAAGPPGPDPLLFVRQTARRIPPRRQAGARRGPVTTAAAGKCQSATHGPATAQPLAPTRGGGASTGNGVRTYVTHVTQRTSDLVARGGVSTQHVVLAPRVTPRRHTPSRLSARGFSSEVRAALRAKYNGAGAGTGPSHRGFALRGPRGCDAVVRRDTPRPRPGQAGTSDVGRSSKARPWPPWPGRSACCCGRPADRVIETETLRRCQSRYLAPRHRGQTAAPRTLLHCSRPPQHLSRILTRN